MAEFIQQNWGSVLAGAGVLALIVLIIAGIVKDKRTHACGNCSACGCCRHARNDDKASVQHSK